jgi:hypothetical protein
VAETTFRLPVSGFKQVSRILKAYRSASRGSTEATVTLDDVARRTAMNRTAVSANNGFLASIGLIEGGNAKRLTPLGVRAALALDHAGTPEAQEAWTAVVENSPDLERIVDAIRIRQGMDEDALLSHIVLTAGVPRTSRWLTGARTVVDVLEFAGLIIASDGAFRVATISDAGTSTVGIKPSGQGRVVTPTEPITVARNTTRQGIVVNVHVWVNAAEANFAELADQLKEFLAKLSTE